MTWRRDRSRLDISRPVYLFRNDGRPREANEECSTVAAPVLPVGYVVSASRIADRRMILAGYQLADLLTRLAQNWRRIQFNRKANG